MLPGISAAQGKGRQPNKAQTQMPAISSPSISRALTTGWTGERYVDTSL